ncbi:MAG TPA: two-component regulator propeller domain-containing protein, partial [Verrucomicrobiae bacterium]|nr:two-component regulator propeller domain-containing protein [Verrucomicrobiae bacterium]
MSSGPRFFCAGICAVCFLIGGVASWAGASESGEKAPPANLWLTRTWQTDEGLPDNDVTGVAQTTDGHLWVATLGGLMRFDGEHFEEFSVTHLPKVPNHVVREMYLDRRGRLWLVMDRGVVIRVGDTSARVFDASDGFAFSRVTGVTEDNEGGVWFYGGPEVCRIRENQVERFTEAEGLPTGGNVYLTADEHGQIWFASRSRVGIFREGRWQILTT